MLIRPNIPMSIDEFLDRVPAPGYNCLDFTREVWLKLCHEDITKKLTGLIGAFKDRHLNPSGMRSFHRLHAPKSPCLIVMQRFMCVPHCGVWLDDKVLHMTSRGVQFMPLGVAKGFYQVIRFYE